MLSRRPFHLKLESSFEDDEPPHGLLGRAHVFFAHDIWRKDLADEPFYKAFATRCARILYLTVRGVVQDNCMFRASALTYITVLSIIPLLAFAFSAAKGFGAMEYLRNDVITPWLDTSFPATARPKASDAESGEEVNETASMRLRGVVEQVLDKVEEVNFRGLGTIGLLILIYTVIKLLSTVERSFNVIWGVQRSRSWTRKIADYVALVVITPMLMMAAAFAMAVVRDNAAVNFLREKLGLGSVIEQILQLAPLVSFWLGFAFLYIALPNTRAKLSSTSLGALLAAALWVGLHWVLFQFWKGASSVNPIYTSFAALPLMLVWVYASWVVVLLGAELAYAHQAEPHYRAVALTRSTDHAFKEIVALRAMTRIASRFLSGGRPPTSGDVADEIALPVRTVEEALGPLAERDLLAVAQTEDGEVLLPGRDLDKITVKAILDALKGTAGPVDLPARNEVDRRIDAILAGLDQDLADSRNNRTLRDLARAAEPDHEPRPVGELGLDAS